MGRSTSKSAILHVAWAVVCAVLVCAKSSSADVVLHVNAALATGANDGTSWENAFQGRLGLQSALAAAAQLSGSKQIWVAEGTYATAVPGASRDSSFILESGIAIYGGFAGSEALLVDRNPLLHEAILTGDFNDNDSNGPVFDNSRHVVRAIGAVETAILDGLTIQSGYATGNAFAVDDTGGGLYVDGGAPTIHQCRIVGNYASDGGGIALVNASSSIEDCTFIDNQAQSLGGGIGNFDGGSPTIANCRFEENICGHGGGVYNGPLRILGGPPGGAPVVVDCDFVENHGLVGSASGIGMMDVRGHPKITRCRFILDTTQAGGGGLYLIDSAAVIVSSDFVANSAPGDGGGGVYVDGGFFDAGGTGTNVPRFVGCRFVGNNGAVISSFEGKCELIHCTIAHNSVGIPFLVWPPLMTTANSTMHLKNCVVWGNQPFNGVSGLQSIIYDFGTTTADNCIIELWDGSIPGSGNTSIDPLFADAPGPDGVIGTEDDDVRPIVGSPCIDAANLAYLPQDSNDIDDDGDVLEELPLDLDGATRVTRCAPDIGAYELAGGLAHSGDMDGDGAATILDIPEFVEAILINEKGCIADTNTDGVVDGLDIQLFVAILF